jgi:transposase-like protein
MAHVPFEPHSIRTFVASYVVMQSIPDCKSEGHISFSQFLTVKKPTLLEILASWCSGHNKSPSSKHHANYHRMRSFAQRTGHIHISLVEKRKISFPPVLQEYF